jgi:hypothetical protein
MRRDPDDAAPVDPDESRAGIPSLDWEALDAVTPEHVARLGEGLDACDAAELDRRLGAVMSTMRRLDWQTGRLMRLLADLSLPLLMGFNSIGHYVRERLGISAAKARALITLERAPALMEAYSSGRLSWVRAWTVLPMATGGASAAWVERASAVTVRRLEDEVDWALTMQDLTPLHVSLAPPLLGARLELPAAQMRAHCEQAGIDAELTFRGPRSVVALLREAIAAFAEADDLPWRACERLLEHVGKEWRSQPRHPDPVFERDGWRCAVPACSGRTNLHDHHIVFRSHGGTNARSNRVTVCAAHHLHGLHGHRTRAVGTAPDAIHWELGLRPHGPPLMRLIGDRCVSA